MYKRRADLMGFVNGLPLVFIELKASHCLKFLAPIINISGQRPVPVAAAPVIRCAQIPIEQLLIPIIEPDPASFFERRVRRIPDRSYLQHIAFE
jgi:hypothetical protein